MDISVIIPIYKVAPYIEQSLTTLFAQSKREGVEYILVDDASPDNSLAIAHEVIGRFPTHKVQIITKQQNEGLAAARRSGLALATGRYIYHYDSDDWAAPTLLEEMFAAAQKTDADIVVCDHYLAYPRRNLYVASHPASDPIACIKQLLGGELSESVWNKLYRRTLYEGVVTPQGIDVWEDIVANVMLFSQAKRITYLPHAYLYYRQNPTSLTQEVSARSLHNIEAATNFIADYLTQKGLAKVCEESIAHRKVTAKNLLIKMSRGAEQARYAALYPEADSYIDTHPQRTWLIKRAMQCAVQGNLRGANFLYGVARWARRLIYG